MSKDRAGTSVEWQGRGVNATKYVERALAKRAAQHKEDVAKWKKDYPGREPGTSLKTWASYSRQRFPSKRYRERYDQIDWAGVERDG